jgi:cysteine protease ATG4
MSGHHGIQRFIQLLLDKEIENTDLENTIHVLGRQYEPGSSVVAEEEEAAAEAEGEGDKERKSIDNPFDEIKNYFQSLNIVNHVQKELEKTNAPWPAEFINDVNSRLWFTYRTHFKPLARDDDGPSPLSLKTLLWGQVHELHNDYFTTDCGWGCMIRTSQTLLANALLKLKLGSEWEYSAEGENDVHDEVVRWFIDSPEEPFSIHKIVEKGRLLAGKKAGEWFGPSAAARSIQSLCAEYDCGLNVYIGSGVGDIYEPDLFKVFKKEGTFRPTLILLGVRLGVENINPIYWESLKSLLASGESCGISGGRPSSSHYFFGYQGDFLFYIDPHYPQPSLEFDEETSKIQGIETVHTKKIRKIHISEVDPSMLIGILIQTEDEWHIWKSKIQDTDSKNTIVHISPDNSNSELMNRKPSFVVYNEDGDDFVDVGYEDLDEEEPVGDAVETMKESRNIEEYEISDLNPEADVSLISIPQPETTQVDPKSTNGFLEEQPVPVEISLPDASFENLTGEIKDDYENIDTGTLQKVIDDRNTAVEVESIQQEEPYVVDKFDIGSPERDVSPTDLAT